ncbi:MAG: NAD-dependent epimerase/dehydratase family protein [candidate division KSB1 bacterium]|nr:NAD-dependent epimerase/dehydratase family protein [candidate division KSB1 bacterium]MDZ7319096.1 NAD-dependent epimerase/dehydratase family protein [candidate division KSB1 bacterium]MDZ7340111.1 NAD-dependent epimerase/dehydratase family protein [candidate division KSB1 bacterium]
MDVLIIGGTRFLGLHLTQALLRSNQNVTLFNRGTRRNQVPFYEDVEWLIGDRRDEDRFRSLFANRQFDVVIDTCAFYPEEVQLVVEVFQGQIGRYIFTSSMAVALTKEIDERLVLPIPNRRLFDTAAHNSYAYNKSMIEEYLVEQFDKTGFPFVSLRPTEINGPGEIREWYYIDRIRNGRQKILIPGAGENLFQPAYIDDVIQAYLLAIVKENAVGECYNLAGDEIISLNDFVKLVAEVLGERVKTVNIPYHLFRQLVPTKYFFPFNNKHSFIVDLTKIKSELGYQPEISIKDGIRKSYENWPETYSRKFSPFNPSGEFEFISFDLEDALISAWEKEIQVTYERVHHELLKKGMLI